jgi:hypothetical protein
MCYAQAQVLGSQRETPRHNDILTHLFLKIQTKIDNLSSFVTSDVSHMVAKTSMFGPLNP